MNDNDRALFLENDLLLLYSQYQDKSDHAKGTQELHYPDADNLKKDDLWTNALLSILNENPDEKNAAYAAIAADNLPEETLKWWRVLFSMGRDTSLEELNFCAKGSKSLSGKIEYKVLDVAATLFAEDGQEEIQRRRESEINAEKKKLRELEKQKREKRAALENADSSLRMHMNTRGNNR